MQCLNAKFNKMYGSCRNQKRPYNLISGCTLSVSAHWLMRI
uniref:Uncharacterized protein n=1 Tax=Anguilla anguilla TaxID=7936 RepID=A0A0E9T7Y4_ANGAN